MKAILLAAALAICGVTVYAGEGLSLRFLIAHYNTLTNTANFHETYSTTNMPPKLLQSILKVLGSMGGSAGRTPKGNGRTSRAADPRLEIGLGGYRYDQLGSSLRIHQH